MCMYTCVSYSYMHVHLCDWICISGTVFMLYTRPRVHKLLTMHINNSECVSILFTTCRWPVLSLNAYCTCISKLAKPESIRKFYTCTWRYTCVVFSSLHIKWVVYSFLCYYSSWMKLLPAAPPLSMTPSSPVSCWTRFISCVSISRLLRPAGNWLKSGGSSFNPLYRASCYHCSWGTLVSSGCLQWVSLSLLHVWQALIKIVRVVIDCYNVRCTAVSVMYCIVAGTFS